MITPEFIAHEEFHTGKWLLPVKRPSWYYFKKGKIRHRITSRKFYKSVDPPLKNLVAFLHKKNITTTPSCSGHHKNEKDFRKIYDALKEDETEIKNEGLEMEDIESGKKLVFRNKKYKLPWTKKEFLKGVMHYQGKGILGIQLKKNDKRKTNLLDIHLPGVSIKPKGAVILILVEQGDGDHRILWKKIGREVKKIFRK
jgi:hypothetical protein